MKAFILTGALIAGTASSVAHAQLYYTDEFGRASELSSPQIPELTLSLQGRGPDEVAALFYGACLESKLDATAIESVVSVKPWEMLRRDIKIPFTDPAYDPLVPRWLGGGMSLIATPVTIGNEKGSRFRIIGPQCTLASGEASFPRQELEESLTQVIGRPPSNAAEASKNGKPRKNYSPRWQWIGANGEQHEIGITMMSSSRNYAGRLQVSLIPPKPVKKK